ncbi:MAG: DUF4174 domain-containing protein [Rhodobacteraceae bacterium]|nr:DUF4174 domain-containing protein [Paracoccaceae bacterium]
MTRLIAMIALSILASTAAAEDAEQAPETPVFVEASVTDLNDLIWLKRPIIVFADSENDPRFRQQMDFLRDRVDDLRERDVVVMTDTTPSAMSPLREKLRPRGFMLVLIGKDGGVKLRKPFPWDVREIGRTIDKMPMRQREIRERKSS